jgi:hypothetical protein
MIQGSAPFLKQGPKNVLTGLIQSILKDRSCHALSVDSSNGRDDGLEDLAKTLCYLSALGYPVKLDQWENPLENNMKKQRMSIAVSGANIRVESKRKKQSATLEKPVNPNINKDTFKSNKPESKNNFLNSNQIGKSNGFSNNLSNNQQKNMTNQNKHASEQIQNALRVVQDGMKSMQTLQMQTAETHKKFLETQSEAGRMLQQMMANIQRLAETTLGVTHDSLPETEKPRQDHTEIVRQPIPAPSLQSVPAPGIVSAKAVPETSFENLLSEKISSKETEQQTIGKGALIRSQ